MMKSAQTLWIVTALGITSCSSMPKGVDHAGEERVLSRINDLSARPDWLDESQPFRIENGEVMSLGMTVVPVDNTNLSAVYRIVQNNAKAGISHSIEQRLDFVFQNAEEGISLDSTQAKYIGSEASKLTTSSLRPSKLYWEKVAVVQESGQSVLRYRVFALVKMPEQDFKSAITDAIRRSQGKTGLSAEFAKQVNDHWDKFTSPQSPERQPASEPKTVSQSN